MVSTDTQQGWFPGATRIAIPATNYGLGYTRRDGVVLHIIVGTQAGAKARFQNAAERVSAHFSISKTGHIEQYVSVLDTAYANGLSWNGAHWVDPEDIVLGVNGKPAPSWVKLAPPLNPNAQTISLEHEGQPSDVPTPAMTAACTTVLRWLGTLFSALRVYVPHQNLIGHCEISPASKPNCPGPSFDFTAIAAAANGLYTPGVYEFHGVPVFQRADLKGAIAGYLPSDSTFEIDATSGPNYAPTAGHLTSGLGFVDLSMPGVLRKL